ncbi:hypothetical protein ACS0TY_017148 [Phlomoides rotata]
MKQAQDYHECGMPLFSSLTIIDTPGIILKAKKKMWMTMTKKKICESTEKNTNVRTEEMRGKERPKFHRRASPSFSPATKPQGFPYEMGCSLIDCFSRDAKNSLNRDSLGPF